jgi:tetratricopeptide (TPR) repeat protein
MRKWALGIVVILFTVTAFAAPDNTNTLQAREHYQSGLAHFNLQEYKEAIPEFEAAYRLVPDGVFLYNLAQAHRLADNPERALYFYRAYLRSEPGAANRQEVEGRIATLEKLISEKRKVQTPPDQALAPNEQGTAAVAGAPVEKAASAKTPVYKKWWLWTVVGVVAVGGAVGLGVGLSQRGSSFNPSLGTIGPSALEVR